MLYRQILTGIGAVLMVAAIGRAADATKHIEVRLRRAVFAGPEQLPGSPSLLLNLTRQGERWERVVGTGAFNRAVHMGYVAEGSISEQAMALTLEMNIESDPYVKGGRGVYKLALTRKGDRFEGEYTGTFRGAAVKGPADAVVLPALRAPAAAFAPVQPGEHPRILFRKADLPALREKAKTPFGQAALEKMTDGIGLGIKYQLTGEKQFAEQSRQFVERLLNGDYSGVKAPGSHHGMLHYGPVWEQAGVSYDLCYDAWTPEFRERVEQFIMLWTRRILSPAGQFNTQAQYDYGNHESGWFYYGPALSCLAMWGEKGAQPPKPIAPEPVTEVPPAEGYKPGKDVPVLALEAGKAPTAWLATQPLDAIVTGDPLKEIGGFVGCRPENGTSFTCADVKTVFTPLAKEWIDPATGVILNLGKSLRPSHVKKMPGPEIKKDGPLTMFFYTVLDNPTAQWVKVNCLSSGRDSEMVVLNGHVMTHGQVVKLRKGLYPMFSVVRIAGRRDRMTAMLLPAAEADVETAKPIMAAAQARYENELRDWERDRVEWQRTGGFDQDLQKLFEITRWLMYTHYREGIGTGGFQPETSTSCVNVGLLPATYTAAYLNVFGTMVSPYADIAMYVPRRIFSHFYPEGQKPWTQEFNGPNDLSNDLFICNFSIIPDEWKPVALWAWNRQSGVSGQGDAAKVLEGSTASIVHRAFLSYPLRTTPKSPAGTLPLNWAAPDFGYYGFRNAYSGNNDFLVQIYGRCATPHGYNMPNAGHIGIVGDGDIWAVALPSLRLHNQRSFGNVVLLPDDLTNEGGCGAISYSKLAKDGSGVVTIDLSDVYAAAQNDDKGKPQPLYEKYGKMRRDGAFKESGITGLRSLAVDYSGKSGASCLIALVDKIDGGKTKVWKWILTNDVKDQRTVTSAGDLSRTKVEGNVVTVTKPDGATMRMTFVGPKGVQVKAENRAITYTQTYGRGEAQMPAPGIYASGADPADGQFFVVATIQKGEAPAVKVEGAGLSAKVQVGRQSVRFDGKNVVMGE